MRKRLSITFIVSLLFSFLNVPGAHDIYYLVFITYSHKMGISNFIILFVQVKKIIYTMEYVTR